MQFRLSTSHDLGFLWEMLIEAFYWDGTLRRPSLEEFRRNPEAAKLLSGWGRPGDCGVIAEHGVRTAGAAWFRLWSLEDHSYGFVSPDIPEVSIAIASAFRSQGIGRALLQELIGAARSARFPGLSLSVSPANRARSLYEQIGFRKVGESGTSWTYLLSL